MCVCVKNRLNLSISSRCATVFQVYTGKIQKFFIFVSRVVDQNNGGYNRIFGKNIILELRPFLSPLFRDNTFNRSKHYHQHMQRDVFPLPQISQIKLFWYFHCTMAFFFIGKTKNNKNFPFAYFENYILPLSLHFRELTNYFHLCLPMKHNNIFISIILINRKKIHRGNRFDWMSFESNRFETHSIR